MNRLAYLGARLCECVFVAALLAAPLFADWLNR